MERTFHKQNCNFMRLDCVVSFSKVMKESAHHPSGVARTLSMTKRNSIDKTGNNHFFIWSSQCAVWLLMKQQNALFLLKIPSFEFDSKVTISLPIWPKHLQNYHFGQIGPHNWLCGSIQSSKGPKKFKYMHIKATRSNIVCANLNILIFWHLFDPLKPNKNATKQKSRSSLKSLIKALFLTVILLFFDVYWFNRM